MYEEMCDDELPLQLHEDTLLDFADCDVVLVILVVPTALTLTLTQKKGGFMF